jgi:hypothetical protein
LIAADARSGASWIGMYTGCSSSTPVDPTSTTLPAAATAASAAAASIHEPTELDPSVPTAKPTSVAAIVLHPTSDDVRRGQRTPHVVQ